MKKYFKAWIQSTRPQFVVVTMASNAHQCFTEYLDWYYKYQENGTKLFTTERVQPKQVFSRLMTVSDFLMKDEKKK